MIRKLHLLPLKNISQKIILNMILIFSVLFPGIQLNSQTNKLYTTDNNLSNSLINQVFNDSKGIIWIATEDGLNKYDGAKFTIYRYGKDNPKGILNNYVRAIFEDKSGLLYFGYLNGLQVYDHATDTFTEVPLYNVYNEKTACHIFSIIQRKNGDVLIASSGSGMFKLEMKNGKPLLAKQITGLVNTNFIQTILEDSEQNLWLLTQSKGLYKVSNQNKVEVFFDNIESDGNLSSICEDAYGNIYISKLNYGLFRYNKQQSTFDNISRNYCKKLPIKTLYVANDEQILMGTDGCGIKSYNIKTNSISETDFGITQFDISKTKVHSIVKDNYGNLWMGIYQKGVVYMPSQSNNFKYIGYKSFDNNSIGSSYITALFKDHKNILWVGTDGDGVYGINPDGSQYAHFKSEQGVAILCIYEDSNNTLWVGTYLNGMAWIDPNTGAYNFIDVLKDAQNQNVEHIYAILEDKNKNLWIATMGSGIYCMNISTGKVNNFGIEDTENKKMPIEDKLFNNWVNCLFLSSDNKLYIGTYDGIGCYDLTKKSFILNSGENHLLDSKIVNSVYEDPNGNIWIGTSEGLYFKDKKTGLLTNYTTKQGLPNNVICAIQGDNNNDLWVSTHYGISKFNPITKHFTNYYYGDGLQGNEFSRGACLVDHKNLYFGGINGISYFNPEQITDEGKIPELKITACYIRNKEITKGMKSGSHNIINSFISEADSINLAYKDNTFNIEFATANYIEPDRLTYSYSINGQDWISLRQGVNSVTFNDLMPGSYTLMVKAKEYKTFSPVKTLSIIISPPWYFSVWAKICYALMASVIVAIIIQQIKQRQKTKEKIREQNYINQIHEAKLQFFINISHEIKTPISLLTNPLKKLIETDFDGTRQKAYQVMKRNSDRILLLINQLMDMRKIDKGQIQLQFQRTEIISMIEDISSLFDDRKEAKNLRFEFEHDVPFLFAWVDPKYFDKIIQNILSNAFKFTPDNGRIRLSVLILENKNGKDYIQIKVSDTGKGIHQNDIERIFERFYQSHDSEKQPEGTGIGLHLTRSIVNLHYGSIKAENNEDGKGCSFIIEIPMGKEHLSDHEIHEPSEKQDPVFIKEVLTPTITVPDEIVEEAEKVRSKSKYKVLIVDDDEEIRMYLKRELSSSYHIMESCNGKEALSMLLQKLPNLIISDVKMPEMDGITLCRKVKQNVNVNHIPVILLTAKSGEKDNLEGLDIGADAYLLKPFNIDILKKTVQNIIQNRELLKNNFSGNQLPEDQLNEIKIKSSDEKLVQKVITIINNNISNPELNVEMIASEIGLSRVHLYRKLKELTNQSARDLIKNIRLKQAGTLLSGKKLSITEVTYATGFPNVSKFSSSFREFYGVSPKVYRELHSENKEVAHVQH